MWERADRARSVAPTMGIRSALVSYLFNEAPAPAPPPAVVESAAPPTDIEKAKTNPKARVGAPGYAAHGGYLQGDERHPDMVGDRKWQKFGEYKRNVAPVVAALRAYLVLLGSPDWNVEPYKAPGKTEATPEDVERAAFALAQIHGMDTPWRTVVQVAGMSMFDGAAFQAWTMKQMADGRFGLLDLESRPMHTIVRWLGIETEGKVTGIVQRSPQTQAEIEIYLERLVWSRDLPISDSPEGVGLLRQLAESIREMQELRRLRNKGYEKDLNGVPIAYAPIAETLAKIGVPGENGKPYTEDDFKRDTKALMELITAQVRKDAGLILDSGTHKDQDGKLTTNPLYRVDLLHAQATSHAELNKTIRELCYEILMMIGFEHLMIGGDGVGSLALHASKIAGTLRIVTSVLNAIADTMRRGLLRPLWIMNGWDPETVPKLTWDALEFEDLDKVVQSIATLLTGAGVEPGRADEIVARILAHLGLPPLLDRDDESLVIRREEAADRAGLDKRPKVDDEDVDTDDLDNEED
jgi:hypothetical protein